MSLRVLSVMENSDPFVVSDKCIYYHTVGPGLTDVVSQWCQQGLSSLSSSGFAILEVSVWYSGGALHDCEVIVPSSSQIWQWQPQEKTGPSPMCLYAATRHACPWVSPADFAHVLSGKHCHFSTSKLITDLGQSNHSPIMSTDEVFFEAHGYARRWV